MKLPASSSLNRTDQPMDNHPTARIIKRDLPRGCQKTSANMSETKVATGMENRSTQPGKVYAAKKRKVETRYTCNFCSVTQHTGLCFEILIYSLSMANIKTETSFLSVALQRDLH